MTKRKPVMISIDEEIHERAKRAAGLIPFSRWIEWLIKKELKISNDRSGRAG